MRTETILNVLRDGGSLRPIGTSIQLYSVACFHDCSDLVGEVSQDYFSSLQDAGVITQVGNTGTWVLTAANHDDEALLSDIECESDTAHWELSRSLLHSDVLKLPHFQKEATTHAREAVSALVAWANSLDRYTDVDAKVAQETSKKMDTLLRRFIAAALPSYKEEKLQPTKIDVIYRLSKWLCAIKSEDAQGGMLLNVSTLVEKLFPKCGSAGLVRIGGCLKSIIGDVIQLVDGRYMVIVPSCPLVYDTDGKSWKKTKSRYNRTDASRGGFAVDNIGFMRETEMMPIKPGIDYHWAPTPTSGIAAIMVMEIEAERADDFCVCWSIERQECEQMNRRMRGKKFTTTGSDRFFNTAAAAKAIQEAMGKYEDEE